MKATKLSPMLIPEAYIIEEAEERVKIVKKQEGLTLPPIEQEKLGDPMPRERDIRKEEGTVIIIEF
jgi:hypothetical protein